MTNWYKKDIKKLSKRERKEIINVTKKYNKKFFYSLWKWIGIMSSLEFILLVTRVTENNYHRNDTKIRFKNKIFIIDHLHHLIEYFIYFENKFKIKKKNSSRENKEKIFLELYDHLLNQLVISVDKWVEESLKSLYLGYHRQTLYNQNNYSERILYFLENIDSQKQSRLRVIAEISFNLLAKNKYITDLTLAEIQVIEEVFNEKIITFSEYYKKVTEQKVDYYFPKVKKFYNSLFINIPTLFESSFPIIYLEENKYLITQFYYDRLYNYFLNLFIWENNKKWKYSKWNFLEDYSLQLLEQSVSDRWEMNNYIVQKNTRYLDREIDILIYNKNTKWLLLFECKNQWEILEKLYKVKDIEDLFCTSGNKNSSRPIYKGINQLITHSKNFWNIKDLRWQTIDTVVYIFLVPFWTSIFRYFINKNIPEAIDLNYHFMSLDEFQDLIKIGKDYQEIIREKENIESLDLEKIETYLDYVKYCTKDYKNELRIGWNSRKNSLITDFSEFYNEYYFNIIQ